MFKKNVILGVNTKSKKLTFVLSTYAVLVFIVILLAVFSISLFNENSRLLNENISLHSQIQGQKTMIDNYEVELDSLATEVDNLKVSFKELVEGLDN